MKNPSELRRSPVKIARPTLTLGGGERWWENSGEFPLSEISNNTMKNSSPSLRRNSYKNPFLTRSHFPLELLNVSILPRRENESFADSAHSFLRMIWQKNSANSSLSIN